MFHFLTIKKERLRCSARKLWKTFPQCFNPPSFNATLFQFHTCPASLYPIKNNSPNCKHPDLCVGTKPALSSTPSHSTLSLFNSHRIASRSQLNYADNYSHLHILIPLFKGLPPWSTSKHPTHLSQHIYPNTSTPHHDFLRSFPLPASPLHHSAVPFLHLPSTPLPIRHRTRPIPHIGRAPHTLLPRRASAHRNRGDETSLSQPPHSTQQRSSPPPHP